MPRLLAPSISSTSTSSPVATLRQTSHSLQGVGVGPVHAVERLGQDAGGRRLADAAGAGEQIGVADAVAGDRLLQRAGDVLLADQLLERLRPIAASDDDVAAVGTRLRVVASLMASRRSSLSRQMTAIQELQSSSTAGERPPHKETQAYGCCVSTLTRFARPPLQRPLTGGRAGGRTALQLYAGRVRASKVSRFPLG